MKISHILISTALLTLSTSALAEQPTSIWHVDTKLAIGNKNIKEPWQSIDEHGSIGLFTTIKNTNWPVAIAIDVVGTGHEKKLNGYKYENYTAELNVGARYYFTFSQSSTFTPYIGGGLARGYAETKYKVGSNTEKYEGNDMGYWLNAGIDMQLSSKFTIGIDYRKTGYDITLNSNDYDMGGDNFSFTVGYQF